MEAVCPTPSGHPARQIRERCWRMSQRRESWASEKVHRFCLSILRHSKARALRCARHVLNRTSRTRRQRLQESALVLTREVFQQHQAHLLQMVRSLRDGTCTVAAVQAALVKTDSRKPLPSSQVVNHCVTYQSAPSSTPSKDCASRQKQSSAGLHPPSTTLPFHQSKRVLLCHPQRYPSSHVVLRYVIRSLLNVCKREHHPL